MSISESDFVRPNYELDYEEDEFESIDQDNSVEFWEGKQRELVTSVVDYNLDTLVSLIDNGTIDLSPSYQRRFRWSKRRQSQLIESFLMNVPVPPIYLNEDKYGNYSVIDGKQRLLAVSEFLSDRLKLTGLEVFSDANGQTVTDLPPSIQAALRTRPTIRSVIILRQSDPDVKFEVFHRLNTGGVKLNPQEIRNAAFPGPFNDLILELSETDVFHGLLGIRDKEKSAIYQEMRDVEFVLRFFAFRNNWQSFSGEMKRSMDRFMQDHQRPKRSELDEMRADFFATLELVEAAFGPAAFRRWVPESDQWRNQVLASLFDAQMFAVKDLDVAELRNRRNQIDLRFMGMFSEDEFRRSVDSATNTPSYFRNRIQLLKDMLRDVLVEAE